MRTRAGTLSITAVATVAATLFLLCRPAVHGAGGDYAFYKGKVLEFYVPYAIGGGFDAYARGLKPLLQKYIPGVTVVVRNVPGGGGLTGTNQLFRAKPDGLSIGILNGPGMVFNQILGTREALYDLTKMSWIGRVNADTHVLVVANSSPIKTVQDLKALKRPVALSQTGKGSDDFFLSYMAFKALGLPIKNVVGFQSAPEAIMGVLRGEEDGFMDSYSTLEKLIQDGELRVVFQVALSRDDSRIKQSPTLLELVGENSRAMITGATSVFAFERPIAGPPGIPPARLMVLRDALWSSLNDPVMVAWSKKVRPILPLRGADTEKLLMQAMAAGGQLKPLLEESLK
jgi:tripartite-type tricarboxylate transporter receptor subunit TctC